MPVHMRYNLRDHTISANGPGAGHGRDGSIRILRHGEGGRLTGLFEKTVRLNNIPVSYGAGEEEFELIEFNRGSIIDYLAAQHKLEDRRFTFGAKGLFGIGLLGTGLSDEDIQGLFNDCVQGKERPSLSDNGGGEAANALPPIDPTDIRAPRGVRGALGSFAIDFKTHIGAFDPRPGVREAHSAFSEEDNAPASIETYTRAGKNSATNIIVHVRVPGERMPEPVVFLQWYILLENKFGAANIEEIVVYPTSTESPNSVDTVWAEIAKACKAAHVE